MRTGGLPWCYPLMAIRVSPRISTMMSPGTRRVVTRLIFAFDLKTVNPSMYVWCVDVAERGW